MGQVFSRLWLVILSLGWFGTVAWGGETAALGLTLTGREGRAPVVLAARAGEFFTIAFVHSHAKSVVEEKFEIMGPGEFRLRETIYGDFGAGLPHEELPGQRMTFADGRIRLTGYDVPFAVLHLRVGRIADHTIRVGEGETIHLDRWFPPGAEVRVTIEVPVPEPYDTEEHGE